VARAPRIATRMNALSRTCFGQKASLIFVGANEGLITQGFEHLLVENRIVLIKLSAKIIAIHYYTDGRKTKSSLSLSINGKFKPIHYLSIPFSSFDTQPCTRVIIHYT
jgi:hypothetical protein